MSVLCEVGPDDFYNFTECENTCYSEIKGIKKYQCFFALPANVLKKKKKMMENNHLGSSSPNKECELLPQQQFLDDIWTSAR